MVKQRVVIWPYTSKQQLRDANNHIKKDSLKNAAKVTNAIIVATRALSDHPNKHPTDKYKADNDGSFRAFELFHYRIAYQITESKIIIIRVRHTSMEPLSY